MSEVKEGYGFLKTLGIFVILGTVIYYAAVKDWLNSACQTDYKEIEDNNYFSFNKTSLRVAYLTMLMTLKEFECTFQIQWFIVNYFNKLKIINTLFHNSKNSRGNYIFFKLVNSPFSNNYSCHFLINFLNVLI